MTTVSINERKLIYKPDINTIARISLFTASLALALFGIFYLFPILLIVGSAFAFVMLIAMLSSIVRVIFILSGRDTLTIKRNYGIHYVIKNNYTKTLPLSTIQSVVLQTEFINGAPDWRHWKSQIIFLLEGGERMIIDDPIVQFVGYHAENRIRDAEAIASFIGKKFVRSDFSS